MITSLDLPISNPEPVISLFEEGILTEYDLSLLFFFHESFGITDDDCLLLILWLSWATRHGHSCLNLDDIDFYLEQMKSDSKENLILPFPEDVESVIEHNPVFNTEISDKALLIYKNRKLYFNRQLNYELEIANKLSSLGSKVLSTGMSAADLNMQAEDLFKGYSGTDMQIKACLTATRKGLTVITGGPGTGKTHTVLRLLSLLIQDRIKQNLPPPRIAIAAPTGKAAARVKESIRKGLNELNVTEDIKSYLPENAGTIHRLLGYKHLSNNFRYNRRNKLPYDVIIIDEASMIDLSLMGKLVSAISDDSRLILLGDKNQLAAVEGGAVFADICSLKSSAGTELDSNTFLNDAIVELSFSHRFRDDSGIGNLAKAINTEDYDRAMEILQDQTVKDVEWVSNAADYLNQVLPNRIVDIHNNLIDSTTDPISKLKALVKFQVLCAHSSGNFGVQRINQLAEKWLGRNRADSFPFDGLPIIARKNDYNVSIFNGDTGYIRKDESGSFFAIFEKTNESTGETSFREINTALISSYDPAWALTIHKSQGSEYDEVVLILPDNPSPLLTKELLYTGITRAKKKVTVCSSKEMIARCVKTKTRRLGGLVEAFRD